MTMTQNHVHHCGHSLFALLLPLLPLLLPLNHIHHCGHSLFALLLLLLYFWGW